MIAHERSLVTLWLVGAALGMGSGGCSIPSTEDRDVGTEGDTRAAPDVPDARATCPPGDDDCDVCDDCPVIRPPRPRDCEPGTEWVYLIGRETVTGREARVHLLRYEPDSGTVAVVGEPDCAMTPFSMAVDRDGGAWVLSARSIRGLFRLSTEDATCTPTSYVPNVGGWEEFGMGFAADGLDSTSERLYVLGGPQSVIHEAGAEVLFGVLDTTTLTIETRARIVGNGELTGTGEGNLWAYQRLPAGDAITRLDPATGAALAQTYPLGTISEDALAVAFWGGDFYAFRSSFGRESEITRVETRTGRVESIGVVTGHQVVGAGVSTCAPYDLF